MSDEDSLGVAWSVAAGDGVVAAATSRVPTALPPTLSPPGPRTFRRRWKPPTTGLRLLSSSLLLVLLVLLLRLFPTAVPPPPSRSPVAAAAPSPLAPSPACRAPKGLDRSLPALPLPLPTPLPPRRVLLDSPATAAARREPDCQP